ncbi:hypothetical protein T265_09800 [Opisthorchis viverrini]|uniref:Uncharacterized protein n=1 Tax=Opisthorchis viverrini TaxID=6198 RepID=A0A074Z4I6_OPIVI|nr:hypothetical protein T265_09800 [Opisthorchis viverrini]KER22006.1 hypothetical protein T265_09800 [Opisthorchis viverrini]
MSIEFDQLRELLQQQQKQFEEAQLKLIESLTQKLHIQTAAVSTARVLPSTHSSKELIRLTPLQQRHQQVATVSIYTMDLRFLSPVIRITNPRTSSSLLAFSSQRPKARESKATGPQQWF